MSEPSTGHPGERPGPQLSSLATALGELTERVTGIAEALAGTDKEAVALALFEVERSLQTATRRLEQVVDDLR